MQTTINITLKRILATAAARQASDVHLTVGAKPMIKIGGELMPLDEEEVLTNDFIAGVVDNILDEKQKAILSARREIIVGYDFGDRARFRVDIFYQRGFPALVFHYIPNTIKTIRELGLPSNIESLLKLKQGIILVGGQQGSGVTTTMASMVETINRSQARHILILEQPLEYIFTNNKSLVEQKEIGKDIETWLEALDIKGEDVDVLMLGKVPSHKILLKAFRLSASGILVILPVAGTSIEYVLDNIINSFPKEQQEQVRHLLAHELKGIILQKLVPKIGGGVVLALEIAFINQVMAAAIREGKLNQLNNILLTAREEGMIALDRYLVELVKSGQIGREVALREANNPDNLRRVLKF